MDNEEGPEQTPRRNSKSSGAGGFISSGETSLTHYFSRSESQGNVVYRRLNANPASPGKQVSPDAGSDGEETSVVRDESFKALYAEMRDRRHAIRNLLAAGEDVGWDAAVVCIRAPEGADPTPHDGHLLVTDRRFVYLREGRNPVVLDLPDIEPVSIIKVRRGTKAISIVTKSGIEWLFEPGSLNARALKHFANKGR